MRIIEIGGAFVDLKSVGVIYKKAGIIYLLSRNGENLLNFKVSDESVSFNNLVVAWEKAVV
jgi:hypothetical protein